MNDHRQKPRRPFLPMRDGGGSFQIENPDDATPIKEMFSFKDRLLLITEKCTYEVQVADQIDPERKNPDLPHNFQRKLFDYGIQSEALQRILLQARMLLKQEHLTIDVNLAQRLALDALQEFAAMDQAAKIFKNAEAREIEAYNRTQQQPRSLTLPSVGGVDTHCKTFSQKAHYFGRAMLAIAKLFMPRAPNWDEISDTIHQRFGPSDPFSTLIEEVVPNLKLVLNLRDALEHQNKTVTVRDFTVDTDGTIAPPTLELNFRKSVLPRTSVSSLMEELLTALPIFFEMMTVHLSSKFTQPVAGLPIFVDLLPEELQQTRHVRFGYWAKMPNGQVMPFG
ncbi:hypothetical protein [Bradyrhizobium guangdongense]|uniref:hypothetical protein n=1 Tax=Bradyrhizobium guangdongense TaxID=1325090 RepID=UPI00112A20CC|nr:hypothetical protein [Bradyrhizobium guangdongense]